MCELVVMFSLKRKQVVVDVAFVLLALVCGRDDVACSDWTNPVRPHSVSITEFGAVGDGVTLNTKAFENAIFYLNSFSDKGGAKLYVPSGRWLTGSFHLISHLTLSLHQHALILASPIYDNWPLTDPLPLYALGPRHRSLIFGHNLTDIVIAGDNGTIDGQGSVWWNWFKTGALNYTRPHLIEFINSTGIVITNLTFINSPYWAIHSLYCRDVRVKDTRIVAPLDSPNTDGIDADSCTDVCIEECHMSTGNDLVAIKSGTNIVIHRLSGESGRGSAIAIGIGSDMSRGVSQLVAQHIRISNSATALSIKTSHARGGYIRNVYVSDLIIVSADKGIRFSADGDEPRNVIERISIKDVRGENIRSAGLLQGLQNNTIRDVCFYNVTMNSQSSWKCSHIHGYSELVSPPICDPLNHSIYPHNLSHCYHLLISSS